MQMGVAKSTRLSSWLLTQGPEAAKMIEAAVHNRREVKLCKSSSPRRIILSNVESKLFSYLAILI
jgi:hypothetical protein